MNLTRAGSIATAGARAAMAVRQWTGVGSRSATRSLVVLGVLATALGVAGSGPAAAQGDGSAQMHSPLFGLTVTWGDQWQAAEVYQDDGTVWVDLVGDHADITLWAAPAFGGDGSLCIDEIEARFESDPAVSNLERSGAAPALVLPTAAASELWRMDYQPEGETAAIPWSYAAWCITLQPGYSILQVELEGETSQFEQAVTAAADIVVSTTAGLPSPDFVYAADRDDLTSFWSQQFATWARDPYIAPTYLSFSAPVPTLCGPLGPLEIGTNYCQSDNVVYVDGAAADDLASRYGVGISRFLMGHETGHHVARLLGYSYDCELSTCLTQATNTQQELMADCFAGAWMANASERGILSDRDVEDALVGVADSFSSTSHGSSALRLWWLLQGFHGGADACFDQEVS